MYWHFIGKLDDDASILFRRLKFRVLKAKEFEGITMIDKSISKTAAMLYVFRELEISIRPPY